MAYCIIIRGPLGVGKSTVARNLAKVLNGKCISIDNLLNKSKLDKIDERKNYIPAENFIKAIENTIPEIKSTLKNNNKVILDGNFYHRNQISHLAKELKGYKIYIFTLRASLDICIKRNNKRKNPYEKTAIKSVYDLVSRSDQGIKIDTDNKTSKEVEREILTLLPKQNRNWLK